MLTNISKLVKLPKYERDLTHIRILASAAEFMHCGEIVLV